MTNRAGELVTGSASLMSIPANSTHTLSIWAS